MNSLLEQFYALKLRTQLLLLVIVMTAGFVISGILAYQSYQKVIVRGDVYDEIVSHKDLAADILPPPFYLLESWQLALQMVAIKNQPLQPLIEQSQRLSAEFHARGDYWVANNPRLSDFIKQKLLVSGDRFIQIRDAELIPALQAHDDARINQALNHLQTAYQTHRQAVDELVRINDKAFQSLEAKVPDMVSSAQNQTLILAILALAVTLVGLMAVIGRVIRQLGGEASQALAVAQNIAEGDFVFKNVAVAAQDKSVIGALNLAVETLKHIDAEMARMEHEHNKGNIDANIDVTRFKGAYRDMAIGINRMVAHHISVMTKSTQCITALSHGDFSAELERFPGKLALVNEGVEGLRENVCTLISDMRHMAEAHNAGNISVFMNPEKFDGDYRLLAQGVNAMVKEYIEENQTVTDCILQFGNGDFSATIKEFPGEKAFINKSVKKIGGNLKGLIDSVNWVSNAHEQGDIDMTLRDDMFKGDFRTLAKSVNTMMAGLLEMNQKSMQVVKAFGEGNFDAPLERFAGKKAFINETIEQVRSNLQALDADTTMLARAAKEGHITVRADAKRHQGGYRKIVEGINQTLDLIVEPIVVVKDAVATITTAASEISSGNVDLSARTEQQASSLQQTAASMEQLASTVKQNAENALQANQLALTASETATRGGEVVAEVVTTMSAINQSAKKIEDIISVIDGIAFQTNILALNAAVEAARAGEQGRGFAVVAGEVRSLAQRSATAAKEIKTLIADSVSQTADGTRLVENAGTTMQEVVSSVQRVAEIIGEISAASVEQSSGIDQVNEAVTRMDDTTQQNAALVEEAAAAAESLVEQANQLAEVVSQFKLEGNVNTGFTASVKSSSDGRGYSASQPALGARSGKRVPPPSGYADKPHYLNPPSSQSASRPSAKTGTDDSGWEEF